MSLDAARFTQAHPLDGPPYRMTVYLLQHASRARLELLHKHDVSCEESLHGEVFLAAGLLYSLMNGAPLPGGITLRDIPATLRRKLIMQVADLFDYTLTPIAKSRLQERRMLNVAI